MITQFDRATCRMVSQAIEKAVQGVAEEFGIGIRRGRGTFSGPTFTMKLECGIKENGEVLTKEAQDFKQLASAYGLKPTDLGRTFCLRGNSYKIVGLKARSTKYPILVERADGKRFKQDESTVKAMLAA